MMKTEWRGFKGNLWQSEVNLRDFIQHNYTSYDGDESFLAEPTQATNTLWGIGYQYPLGYVEGAPEGRACQGWCA